MYISVNKYTNEELHSRGTGFDCMDGKITLKDESCVMTMPTLSKQQTQSNFRLQTEIGSMTDSRIKMETLHSDGSILLQ